MKIELFFVRKVDIGDELRRVAVIRKTEIALAEFNVDTIVKSMFRSETGLLARFNEAKQAYNLTNGVLIEKPVPENLILTRLPLCRKCKGTGGNGQACIKCEGDGLDFSTIAILRSEGEAGKCGRCAGTGDFITGFENGKPTGPGGICHRCAGKGKQFSCGRQQHMKPRPVGSQACCDIARNALYDLYGVKFYA